jgi:hypothetical protein
MAAQPRREREWWRGQQPAAFPEVAAYAQPRDQIRWGPIWGGVIVTLATLIILSVLGMAIGLTALEPGTMAMEAGGIAWGVAMAVIAFLVGGYTAGRTSAVAGPMAGMFNGVMVWALAVVLALLFMSLGAGAAMGIIGAFGITVAEVEAMFVGMDQIGLWWTFAALAIGLIVCAVGGLLGAPRHAPEAGRTATVEE